MKKVIDDFFFFLIIYMESASNYILKFSSKGEAIMKKLMILFLAFCIMIAVGCSNDITNNVITDQQKAIETIPEGSGDSSSEGIANFLSVKDYNGVFATEAGFVGYKIKDSKIYFVEEVNKTNDKWTEITEGITVSKNLNKLQYQTQNGLEILTFDGFGYYYYIQGGATPSYYKKYDYLDTFAGTWKSDDNKTELIISADGCITRYSISGGYKTWTIFTSQAILEGDTLTFKGADRSIVKFDLANGTATYNGNIELKKQ